MNKHNLLIILVGFICIAKGQISKDDLTDYFAKLPPSTPHCYSSTKIWDMIKPEKEFGGYKQVTDDKFDNFNALEHFIHSVYYPENFYQVCSHFETDRMDSSAIYGYLKFPGEGYRMSERQGKALTKRRDSTILLLKQCISKHNIIDIDHKRIILDYDMYELIPTIVNVFHKGKKQDNDLLTLLCLLMHKHYTAFIKSDLYKNLYPERDEQGYTVYSAKINYSVNRKDEIIRQALNYFQLENGPHSKFSTIPGGTYSIGKKGHEVNPLREVTAYKFQISKYEITNQQFLMFVERTGYVTLAEKNKNAMVFREGLDEFEWIKDSTANWKFPNGQSQGGITDKMDHPVTSISYKDAQAYCTWAGYTLPFYEQWEIASKGGSHNLLYHFGDSSNLINQYANIWKGQTHLQAGSNDKHITTSPVGSFKPNQLGLFDMYGNVFEFCSGQLDVFKNKEDIVVSRGGSWWCSANSCGYYNSCDIGRIQKEASFSNVGFRVVR